MTAQGLPTCGTTSSGVSLMPSTVSAIPTIKTDLSDVAVLPNGTVRAQLTISAESTPLTVTRVELYNSDNALWAHQDCSITVNTGQTGILYWFDFTVTEQEVK